MRVTPFRAYHTSLVGSLEETIYRSVVAGMAFVQFPPRAPTSTIHTEDEDGEKKGYRSLEPHEFNSIYLYHIKRTHQNGMS